MGEQNSKNGFVKTPTNTLVHRLSNDHKEYRLDV